MRRSGSRYLRSSPRRGISLAIATLVAGAATSSLVAAPAAAFQIALPNVVSPVPAAGTPDINDGRVLSIATVGGQMILGGDFTTVSPAADAGTVYPLANVFAFNATTYAIDDTGFVPTVNGQVNSVIAGPKPDEVYIGGAFTNVDGKPMRVALLNTTTGALVPGWKPAALNATVNKLVLADDRLFVAGVFTSAAGKIHRGLVALAPHTGKVTSYVNLSFTGHHNYGTKCNLSTTKCAPGSTGVKSIDVNPAGNRMVAVGNFTDVSGAARDQVAQINLGKHAATVNQQWKTLAYTATCFDKAFDSYIRDVQFSPDGSYFVIASSGGIGTNSDGTQSSCDSASRYETNARGTDVRPTWIAYTGEDTIWTVAVTGSVVYVGGHQRWINNPQGKNVAAAGAIPRPGIAALNPLSGLPYSWNPGRNPRGAGCFALLATPEGLWIGSDTDYIGNHTYLRQKVALFPLAGGDPVAADATPTLPGRVYQVGATATDAPDADRFAYREFNGGAAGAEIPVSTGLAWGSVHGAFEVDGEVIYGQSDGNLYERSFDGTTFGSEVELDPWNDPTWENVQTGSGQTYASLPSSFSAQIPFVTSMFFRAGKLYYTLAGKKTMHWRWFEPESGAINTIQHKTSAGTDWSDVAGAFLGHNRLYFADSTTGELMSLPWTAKSGAKGTPTVADASTDWASNGLFLLSQSTNPTPTPVASYTSSCQTASTCTFTAAPWTDPDGGRVRYAWDFGDGATQPLSDATTTTHRFWSNGAHHVTLSVIATSGAKATSTQVVTISAPLAKIGFDGDAARAATGKTNHVKVPGAAKRGDALLLFDSYASTTVTARAPAGWKLAGHTEHHGLTAAVYERVARTHDRGSKVTVRFSHPLRSTLIAAAYRNTAALPIETVASAQALRTRRLAAPTLRGVSRGSWAVGYWTQLSPKPTKWKTPHGLAERASVHGSRRPADSAVLADSARSLLGTVKLGSARASRRSTSAAQWSLALAPALA